MASMDQLTKKLANCLPRQYWSTATVCCFLGLLWAASPLFHGIAHFAELPHEHPHGSVHGHSVARWSSEDPTYLPSSDHPSQSSGRGSSYPQSDDQSNDFGEESEPAAPHPTRPNGDDAPVIYLLEIVASASTAFEITLDHALLFNDLKVSRNLILPAAELGTIGPRGPPA